MITLTCDTCHAPVNQLEGHFTGGGFLCDNCYFSAQPWHTPDEDGEGELC